MTPVSEFGPQWGAIEFVRDTHVPHLTKERTDSILLMARLSDQSEKTQRHAFEAARLVHGREKQMVDASEALRASVWDVIWDSRWQDAWHLSWVIARLGIGLATFDLIGTADYSVDDYMRLAGPWLTGGFSDMPIKRWADDHAA